MTIRRPGAALAADVSGFLSPVRRDEEMTMTLKDPRPGHQTRLPWRALRFHPLA
jgi:hypothetical protein